MRSSPDIALAAMIERSSRFRTNPLRHPNSLRFFTSRPTPTLCQLWPERSGGRRNSFAVNDGRTACPAKRGLTPADTGKTRLLKRPAPPQQPLPNGRDAALPRPCDGGPCWLRRRLHCQRHVAGRGGVSARGGRLRAADRVGRGPDQRAGGANVPLECFSLRIKNYLNGRAIETGGTHFD